MNELEIYFGDLDSEAQERVLEFYGVETADEINADICPLFVLQNSEDSEEDDELTKIIDDEDEEVKN